MSFAIYYCCFEVWASNSSESGNSRNGTTGTGMSDESENGSTHQRLALLSKAAVMCGWRGFNFTLTTLSTHTSCAWKTRAQGIPRHTSCFPSPLLLSVPMAGLPEALKRFNNSFFYVCRWHLYLVHWLPAQMSGNNSPLTMQAHLVAAGLEISMDKSCFVLFPEMYQRAVNLTISIGGLPIKQTSNQASFLGVMLDHRMQWHAMDTIISSPILCISSIRRITGTRWWSHSTSVMWSCAQPWWSPGCFFIICLWSHHPKSSTSWNHYKGEVSKLLLGYHRQQWIKRSFMSPDHSLYIC